jgi:RHS repeat-associated protein
VGYAGYQWDQVARAYHVRYRVYLPEIGRWTRRDPLGYVGGVNLLSYVRSQPVGRVDPSGLVERTTDNSPCTKANAGAVRFRVPETVKMSVTPNGMLPKDVKRLRNIKKILDYASCADDSVVGTIGNLGNELKDDAAGLPDILDLYINLHLLLSMKAEGVSIWTEVEEQRCVCRWLLGCDWETVRRSWIECKGGVLPPPFDDLFEYPVRPADLRVCRGRVLDDIPRDAP